MDRLAIEWARHRVVRAAVRLGRVDPAIARSAYRESYRRLLEATGREALLREIQDRPLGLGELLVASGGVWTGEDA